MNKSVRAFAVCLTAALVVVAALQWFGWRNHHALDIAAQRRKNNQQILLSARALGEHKDHAEALVREYVLRNDDLLRARAESAAAEAAKELANLRRLTADNPRQREGANRLDSLLRTRVAHFQLVLAARQSDGMDAAVRLIQEGTGRRLSDQIEAILDEIEAEGRRADAEFDAEVQRDLARASLFTNAGYVFAFALILAGAFALRREILRRDQTLAELGAARRDLEAIMGSIAEGIHAVDAEGRIVFENHAAARLLGCAPCELVGKPAHATIHHTHADGREYPRRDSPIHQTLADGRPREVRDEVFWRKGGSSFPVEYSTAPLKDAHGRITGAVVAFRDVSKRKEAEATSQAQRQLLEAVINFMPAAVVFVRGSDLRVQMVNPAFQAISPAKEVLGRTLDEIWPGTGRDLAALCRHVLETGQPYHVEDELNTISRRPDGPIERTYISWSLHRVCLPGDEGWGIVGTAWETTARKRAETERKAFFDSNLDLFCIADGEGRFRRVNPAFTSTLGWTEAELRSQPFLDFVHPDDREATVAQYQRQREGEAVLQFENRYRHKDGSWRCLSWRATEFSDEHLVYATARDITDLKTAQAALNASEQRFRALATAATNVIWTADADGKVVTPVHAWAQFTGAPPEATLHDGWSEAIHPDDKPRVIELWLDCVKTGREFQMEYRARRHDGVYRTVLDRGVPVHQADGSVREWIGSVVDITEKKEAEAALARSKAAAEEANRAKSQFLANMSHELRTPLNAIIGFSELLEDQTFGPLNAKQARYVANVLSSGRHLLQIINDILDIAKIEAGRLELETEEFAPDRAIDDVLVIVKALARKKHLALATEFAPGLPLLRADHGKFKQVLYNLLSNAVKFTPDRGTVTVRAAALAPAASGQPAALRVVVADTGIGLKPADLPRLFNEFEQIDSTYAREQGGTGLGLALTRKLIALHGGRIWAESAGEGCGCTFSFELPVVAPTAATPRKRASAPPFLTRAPGSARPLVLVVEDDETALTLLEQHLRAGNYDVAHARTGAEALAIARTARPFAITMDILLPDRPGWEVLQEFKADPATRDIPVVVVSITDDKQLGHSLGAADFLVKPVQRDHLLAAVARAGHGATGPVRSVLIVDDEPASVATVVATLRAAGYIVIEARSGAEGLALAAARRPELIILDLLMPHMDGFEVVDRLRADPRTADLPVLIFTAACLTAEQRAQLTRHAKGIAAKPAGEQLLADLARLSNQTAT